MYFENSLTNFLSGLIAYSFLPKNLPLERKKLLARRKVVH